MNSSYKFTSFALKTFITCILLLAITNCCYCQKKNNIQYKWNSLEQFYNSSKLDDTGYLNAAIQLALNTDRYAATKEQLLLFKKIAFGDDKFLAYRPIYFQLLANEAIYQNNDGASIFYAEKREDELKKQAGYVPTLSGLRLLASWMSEWKKPQKGLDSIKKILPFIDSLPDRIATNNIPYITIRNIILILKFTQVFYQQLNDTAHSFQVLDLSKKIYDAVLNLPVQYSSDSTSALQNDLHFMEYQQQFYLKNNIETEKDLRLLIKESTEAEAKKYFWSNGLSLSYYLYLTEFFMQIDQIDSASKYMGIFLQNNKNGAYGILLNERALSVRSELEKRKGNYVYALDLLKQNNTLKDSLINEKMSDISNNLYAQTEADYNRSQLEDEKKQKRQRSLWTALLAAASIIGITILYSLLQQKEKVAKKNIEELNIASRLQIAELEEKNRMAKREEQKRLGMELHDELAGTLAAIKMQLAGEVSSATDRDTGERLENIKALVETAYEGTRNKSHEWYDNNNEKNINSPFDEIVNTILEKSVPAAKYEKEIYIDNNSLDSTSLNVKIELLYIIREAVANILKHAKATRISILIYKDFADIVLQIIDNGIGFDQNKIKKGIGLSSLKERANKIGGKLTIGSGKDGTEIIVAIAQ